MKISINSSFFIVIITIIFAIISCSEDNDDPNPFAITVTTSDFTKTMDENPTTGDVIGSVQGSTSEGAVTFLITEQNPVGALVIDSASGELVVANGLLFDFETNPIISGTVRVYNGIISKDASVTITLNDVNEQNIFNGSVVLSTQEEVNTFGAQKYVEITGDLIIGRLPNTGLSNITDLSPLGTLKTIGGRLYFQKNKDLTTTAGLNNLSSLGSDLGFIDNASLLKIEGLNNIAPVIAGNLILNYNPVLENLDGIIKPTAINGNLNITFNQKIPNLNWLSNLVSVEETLTISSLSEIQNFVALSNLQSTKNLEILNNSITDLNGLENLLNVSNLLQISSNATLTNFCSLQNLFINGNVGSYSALTNAYNPTKQDIIDGNCSL